MLTIRRWTSACAQAVGLSNEWIRSNGSFALAFLVVMLVLNCELLAAGAAMAAQGDPELINAAQKAAATIAPFITAAGVAFGASQAARARTAAATS